MKRKTFATVRRYEGVIDPEGTSKKVNEIFVPLISALPGFIEYFWIDLGGGAMMSITVFKTISEAIEANKNASAWVKEHLSSVLTPSIRTEAGPIILHRG